MIVDTTVLSRLNLSPITFAGGLVEAGARIVQFRHKGFWSREAFRHAREIAALCQQAGASFIVNDRSDYASILNAGVHLGQDDLLPRDARTLMGDRPIGFSTHNTAQMRAAAAEPVDYVAFGPVFATGSKERPDPVTGIQGLREVRALTARPLVAIGGITLENAPSCWSAGADSVALISALIPNPCTPRAVRARMEEWMKL